jgi:hypothetical protein
MELLACSHEKQQSEEMEMIDKKMLKKDMT